LLPDPIHVFDIRALVMPADLDDGCTALTIALDHRERSAGPRLKRAVDRREQVNEALLLRP